MSPARDRSLRHTRGTAGAVVSWRDRVEIAVLVLAAVAAAPLLLPLLVLREQFAQVDPSQGSAGMTRDGDPLGLGTLVAMLYVVVVVLPLAGLPSKDMTRGAVVQGIGGLAVAVEALVADLGYFYFTGPDDGCTYSGCWPLHQQTLVLAAPGILTGLSMVLMAFLTKRVRWWVRATVPAAVLLAALAVQYAVWDPYLLPLFQAPPP